MKKTLLLFCISSSLCSRAQITTANSTPFLDKHKYLKFLLMPDSSSQARMFTAGVQYLRTVQHETVRSSGTHWSAGFNVARFFTNKHILGVFIDVKVLKGFTSQKFSRQFIDDFNSGFRESYNTPEDSARAYLLKQRINSSSMFGNYMGNVGIMLSLFPQKYGGVMLSVKKGYRSYVISGIYENKYIGEGKQEIALFDLADNYAFELTIKPYTFFKNSMFPASTTVGDNFLRLFTLSFYYERTNLQKASIEGLPLDYITSASFMQKYGKTDLYGFKIGLMIY